MYNGSVPVYKRVNKNFFKKWSPDMSYVLGFFMADGSITVNPRGSQYISIQICDKEILETMREVMGSEHKIALRRRGGNESDIYRLQIGSQEMCDDLRRLGMGEKKTYTMGLPDIPKKYFGDFVRGYFDGDGHVWSGLIHKDRKNPKTTLQIGFTSCSGIFLKDLQNNLRNFNVGKGSFYSRNNYFCLKYSLKDSLILSEIMYNNMENDLFLKRKKLIFEKFKKMRS